MSSTDVAAGPLYSVLVWAREEGEVKAIDRIRVMVLPKTITEGIVLNQVTPETTCSRTVLAAVREAASRVVGRPCPV
jgi:hypothetical protein